MKSVLISVLISCSVAAFGQTTQSISKANNRGVKSKRPMLIKAETNPVLLSTKRDAAPTQGALTVVDATDKTTVPQSLKKEDPKK
jgi:hypothetical protein